MMGAVRLVLVLALAIFTPPAAANETGKLTQLIDLVGIGTSLDAIPSVMIQGLPTAPEIGRADRDAVGALIARHFSAPELLRDVTDGVSGSLTEAQIDELLAYYGTGVGKLATEMEIAAQQPGIAEQVMAAGTELLRQMTESGDRRLEMYRRIARSTQAVENGISLQMNMTYAVLSGMMNSPLLPYALSDEEILAIVNAQSTQVRADVAEAVFASFAYTYRDMSIDDLDSYAAFLDSPAARTFYLSTQRAIRDALLARARGFGHELMVLIGARKA